MTELVLNLSKDYNKIVNITPYGNRDGFVLRVDGQWLGAKSPDEVHREFEWVTTAAQLRKFRDAIDQALLIK